MTGQHAAPSNNRRLLLVLVVLIVAILLASALWWPDNSPADNDGGDGKRQILTSPTSTSARDSEALAVAECQALLAAKSTALIRADTTMDQWQQHVDAMNQLVAGKIDLDQAVAFWEESEQGAVDNLSAFYDALTYVQNSAHRCRTDSQVCKDTDAALSSSLSRAETAADTWHHHIEDMQALMRGEITPEQAAAAWEAKWRSGNRELKQYRRHLHDAAAVCEVDLDN